MKTIWKFELFPMNMEILMPVGARMLHIGKQATGVDGLDERIYVWAEVDTRAKERMRKIACVGTGTTINEEMMKDAKYIGTAQKDGFVWHYYDCGER